MYAYNYAQQRLVVCCNYFGEGINSVPRVIFPTILEIAYDY